MHDSKRELIAMFEKAILEDKEQWVFIENTISDINKVLHEHNPSFKFSIEYNIESCDMYLSGKTNSFNMPPRKLLTIQIAPLSLVTADTCVPCSSENLATEIIKTISSLEEWPNYAGMIRTFK